MRARLVGVLLLAGGLASAGPALADTQPEVSPLRVRGLRAAEIARVAAQLGSPSADQRKGAFHGLSELNEESLPGIEQRLLALRAHRPDPEAARAALTAFRHGTGSRRADDEVDLADGVLSVLERKRDPATLAMAEPLLLLRALERMRVPKAGMLLAEVQLLDEPGVWDQELKLARSRVGLALLPALISARSHEESRVRAFAAAGVRALGMEDPQVALQIQDAHLRSEVIAAYTQPLDYAAMPLIVRLVTAEKLEVREAARAAVARFGKNAIWQLRELYAEVTGQDADKRWDADKTAAELYGAIDRPAIEEAQTLLARGSAHFVAGRLDAMQRDYDRLLAQFPHFAEREKLAPGYAALGEKLLADDKLEPARAAYQRALRLAPDAEDNDALRAQVAFIEAELALTAGVVDLDGYERALRYDPDHAGAAEAKDRLSGARAARERRQQRMLTLGAIGLLLGCCALLLRGRGRALRSSPG